MPDHKLFGKILAPLEPGPTASGSNDQDVTQGRLAFEIVTYPENKRCFGPHDQQLNFIRFAKLPDSFQVVRTDIDVLSYFCGSGISRSNK